MFGQFQGSSMTIGLSSFKPYTKEMWYWISNPGLLLVCITLLCDMYRKLLLHQLVSKLTPILMWTPAFSRATSRLPVLTLSLPDLTSNSPYCPPYSSYDVSPENLVLDQLTIAQLIFLFNLITSLFYFILIL